MTVNRTSPTRLLLASLAVGALALTGCSHPHADTLKDSTQDLIKSNHWDTSGGSGMTVCVDNACHSVSVQP